MKDLKRIMISVSGTLLQEFDAMGAIDDTSRSQLFQDAISLYLEEQRKKTAALDVMKRGYQEMAIINLSLAEECLSADNEFFGIMNAGMVAPKSE